MKLGVALPSFVPDPARAVAVARAAEASGLDGVFVYDHCFRVDDDGHFRPALECVALLGAVAAATHRIAVGTLVARASLRPPATLRAALATVARLAPGRLIAGIGAGDAASTIENETFGLPPEDRDERLRRLRGAVVATRDEGFPVWVGGRSSAVRAMAASDADGWNGWGLGAPEFTRQVDALRGRAARPDFVCTWGGVVALGADDDAAAEKARRLGTRPGVVTGGPERVAGTLAGYAAAGADWVIVGPVDAAEADNATLLGERVAPALASDRT